MPKINAIAPESAQTNALPDYVARIQNKLTEVTTLVESREQNKLILDHERGMLDGRLIATDPDDTDAFHKLEFATHRVAMMERRAILLADALESAREELLNLNCQAKDRTLAAANRHDAQRDENEISERMSRSPGKVFKHDLEQQSRSWPKPTRDQGDRIHWDDAKFPERSAVFIVRLASEIFGA